MSSLSFLELLDLKKSKINQKKSQKIKISITKDKNQGCLAFGSCLITVIKNQESPKWLKDKINSIIKKSSKNILTFVIITDILYK